MRDNASRLRWGEGAGYLLALLAWLLLSGASALALLTLRSAIGPLTIAILFRNPDNQRLYFRLSDQAGVADRVGLSIVGLVWIVYVFLLEEYLRSSISAAREQRIREVSAGVDTPALRPDLARYGLNRLARRILIAAAFPASVVALYLLSQGVLAWLLR